MPRPLQMARPRSRRRQKVLCQRHILDTPMIYIKLFLDYLDAVEPLGDAERGRLFTALLQYARTGEAPQLGGNERFLFPMMRAQIDRDEAAAEGLSESRSAAGKKGAQARASKARQNRQMPDLPGKASYDKDKDEEKGKEKGKDKGEDRDDGGEAAAAVTACLDRVNPQLSERSRDELAGFARVMGAEVCLRAIDAALDAKKANWPYIKAILQAKQAQGVRCLADWDALEERRQKPGERRRAGTGNPFLAMLEEQK